VIAVAITTKIGVESAIIRAPWALTIRNTAKTARGFCKCSESGAAAGGLLTRLGVIGIEGGRLALHEPPPFEHAHVIGAQLKPFAAASLLSKALVPVGFDPVGSSVLIAWINSNSSGRLTATCRVRCSTKFALPIL
jgi:hypothetical protein